MVEKRWKWVKGLPYFWIFLVISVILVILPISYVYMKPLMGFIIFLITFLIFGVVAGIICFILSDIIKDRNHRFNDTAASLQTALVPVWLGLATVFIFSLNSETTEQQKQSILFTLGTSLSVGGASVLIGALLGFLFAVPRAARTANGKITQSSDNSTADVNFSGNNKQNQKLYTDNTNIEEISDWLTKILVGIGLVQLKTLPTYLGKLERLLQVAIGNGVFGVAIVIHFSVCGFFLGYLASRLFLPGAFSRSVDIENLIEEKESLEAEKNSLEEIVALIPVQSFNETLSSLNTEPADLDFLKQIRSRRLYRINADFKRGEEMHQQLQKLREMKLIRPEEGGSWQVGKHIKLTPLGELFLKAQEQQ